ncbi:MAG TPA: helix-turn-helix domain-containing protein [Myxococcales bacterium]|nr:helix-turn-helix domain-containing protein [Myxococcales bacterium]
MADLAKLFHHQWSLPLLVAVWRKKPLTIARQTHNDTLASLAEQGLVGKDGAVTARGAKVAASCEPLLQAMEKLGSQRKWALPILHALGRKPHRFGELKSALPGATPRALSMALKDLAESGLIVRRVLDGFPPRTEYAVEAKGRALPPLLDQLAKS